MYFSTAVEKSSSVFGKFDANAQNVHDPHFELVIFKIHGGSREALKYCSKDEGALVVVGTKGFRGRCYS